MPTKNKALCLALGRVKDGGRKSQKVLEEHK